MTDFNNVTTEFLFSSLVLVAIRLDLCRDTKFIAPTSLYTSAFGNCSDRNSLCRDKHFVYSVATRFLWLRNSLYCNRVFFFRDIFFFSCPSLSLDELFVAT